MSALWYSLAGLAAGVLSGMGMGGGTVLIPMLTLLQGVGQHAAQGANMLAFLPGALCAIWVHHRQKRIAWRAGLSLLIWGAVGAVCGALLATWMDALWLRRGFGVFLILLALVQLRAGERQKQS